MNPSPFYHKMRMRDEIETTAGSNSFRGGRREDAPERWGSNNVAVGLAKSATPVGGGAGNPVVYACK